MPTMTQAASASMRVVDVRDARVVFFDEPTNLDAATVDALRPRLFELVEQENGPALILDFANVRLLSSASLGLLVTLALKGVRTNKRLALAGVHATLAEVMHVMQLDRFFEFCPSRADAEERFRNIPRPSNEVERLAVLRSLYILDTPQEEVFDRIVRLAAKIFAAPIAQVSLVDEHREWFKARCGTTAEEGPRSAAFCSHTILTNDVLVVPDALADERFRDSPLVTKDGIRFYAGAPLATGGGLNLGALCIKDRVARTFTAAQAEILRDLAALVVEQIESRLITRQAQSRTSPPRA